MDVTSERTLSGRTLVVAGGVTVLLFVAATVALQPRLEHQVRQTTAPRTLREPIASGQAQGQTWEAVARFDGRANCVELRYRAAVLDRACDGGGLPGGKATAVIPGGPVVAYGVAGEDAASVRLRLDGGEVVDTPVEAGDLGFPVGFWAVTLPEGTRLRAVGYSGGQG